MNVETDNTATLLGRNLVTIFRLHRIIASLYLASVRMSVCLSHGFTRCRCAKADERIEVLLGRKTLGGPKNTVLDGGFDPPR